MILPIVAYGDPVLKKKATPIASDYPQLKELIDNMYQTMDNAHGVGLAAPQIGLSIRLFLVDASAFADDEELGSPELQGYRKTFINAEIIEEYGNDWAFNEGCLSIPEIREDVKRPEGIVMRYLEENFVEHTEEFDGIVSRIIQHEYDHIEGVLFTDHLSPLRKRLIKNKLTGISKGNVQAGYKMRFPSK